MKFSKAKPEQARLKISTYGPPGSGKTFTTLLMAEGLAKVRNKRVAYVDTERGTDFYAQAVPARKVHPQAFDFDAIYTRSLAEITSAIKSLNPNEHGVVVLDSISHLWESAMAAYEGRRTSADGIPMHAWGKIKRPYKDLVSFLIASPFDVFILGRQKNLFENDENGQMQKTGVAMRAEGETAYEPHICLRMEAFQDQNKTTESVYCCFVEKDRTGVLAGSVIYNPTFKTIEPLLPLLGETQASLEDEDERVAKDAELLDAAEEKNKAKEEKSAEILADVHARLISCDSLSGLQVIFDYVKRMGRYLVEEHKNAIKVLYNQRRDALVATSAAAL